MAFPVGQEHRGHGQYFAGLGPFLFQQERMRPHRVQGAACGTTGKNPAIPRVGGVRISNGHKASFTSSWPTKKAPSVLSMQGRRNSGTQEMNSANKSIFFS